MNIAGPFISRPVMTTLVMAAFIIFGAIAYTTLPVNDLPAVDFPTISVTATLPGANADTMAAAVAEPLEKQFSTIAGLDSMNSTSSMGQIQVTLQFNLDRSIDGAAEDVQAAIIAAKPFLPTSMPTPPTFRKVNPADSPILYIALSSPTQPLYTVDEYAENIIGSRISMISGVAQVQIYGSQVYAPHVQVDPRKLASYGIGVDEVVNAVRAANVNLPTGTLYGPHRVYNIKVNGQLFNAKDFRKVIVAYRNGAPVHLSDIGDVIDSVQTDKVASWYNNERAVILAVQRQPGTNTIQIIDSIKELFPMFKAILPGSVKLNVLYDRSLTIRKSVSDVKTTLIITAVLVVLVILAFLGNASTTIIASLSLPVSIIGTFGAMKCLGFTINNISLLALTLCVGFVIDDAIVVLENIVRHMEMGKTPLQAALDGAKEIGFTVVSMTLSLVAVFAPILLMGGLIGRLFFEFGMTMTSAILISGFVALSLVPMLCSRFLRPASRGEKKSKLLEIQENAFHQLTKAYDISLQLMLRHKIHVVIMFIVMVIASGYLLVVIPKGFMPNEDIGQIFGMTEATQGISFQEMVRHQQKLAKIVAKTPEIEGFMSSIGAGGPNSSTNQGRIFMVLKPFSERKRGVDEIINDLRKKTSHVPGIRLYLQNLGAIRIGGQLTKAAYQFTLSGYNTDELYASSIALEKKLKAIPGLMDVNTDLQVKNLQLNVTVDRDKLAKLGITMDDIQNALNSAYSARQVSVIYTEDDQFWVIFEVQPQYYKDPSMLEWLRIRSSTGQLVPLNTLATMTRSVGPQLVNHIGQFPSVTISFNLGPNMSLNEAVAKTKELAKQTLPESVTYGSQGTTKVFEDSLKNFGFLIIVCILFIYIVLGILYESYFHPLTILSGLPSAGLGALLILIIFQKAFDIYAFLGLILLIGIVKKNAIMMIDFAVDYERKHEAGPEESIYKAALARFRPIMMTTMAALFGSVPLALASTQGSESRHVLGLTIIGGLLVSQVVTLYITPVFYIYLDRLQKWFISISKRHVPVERGMS